MDSFRYAQFCPVARAAEVLGHRWNLLLLRELFLGPQRFSDLRRRLSGVSSSVLAERLRGLETQGVVAQRELPPPAASAVYELTPLGHAFWPALRAIVRWGVLFQLREERREGDHLEPDWVRLGAACFARTEATPERRIELRVAAERRAPDVVFRVEGGASGTQVHVGEGAVDATVRGTPESLLGAISGAFDPTGGAAPPDVSVTGDPDAARGLPELFSMDFVSSGSPEPLAPPNQKGIS